MAPAPRFGEWFCIDFIPSRWRRFKCWLDRLLHRPLVCVDIDRENGTITYERKKK